MVYHIIPIVPYTNDAPNIYTVINMQTIWLICESNSVPYKLVIWTIFPFSFGMRVEDDGLGSLFQRETDTQRK